MTFEQVIENYLERNCMLPVQIKQVILLVKEAEENKSMLKRWGDDVSGYPEIMQGAILLSVRDHALAWIDENLPLAWFRELLVGEGR